MENNQENDTHDLEEELRLQLIQQQQETDLEINSENDLETESQTDLETAQKLTENASTDSTGTKTDFDIEQKLDRNNLETEIETAENNSDTDSNFGDHLDTEPIIEIEEDPLDDYVQEAPKTNPVQELKKATGDSAKNLKNLADLGEIAFTYIDLAKAQLCSSISGQHVAEYTTDEKAKKVLISAVQEYLSTQEIKAPTPLMTLLLAVGTWAAAGFGAAFWHKYQIKQMEPTPQQVTQEESLEEDQEQGEPSSDFSHLKEYQDERKLFAIHKTTGTYKHLPNNTYCAIDVADELPSPEIKALIEQGKTNPEIRAVLYGE